MSRITDQHTTRRGSSGVGTYLLHRAMPHLPPWLGVAGIGVAGTGAHLLWADSVAAGVGLTLSTVALTGATWWAGRETSPQRRLHSAITVAAGSAWMTGAALAGPLTGILPDTYLMGGAVLALSWNIRMALRTSDGGPATESADKGLLEKVGLARARIGRTEVEPNRVTASLALDGGTQTNDDVARALVRIASALDLPQSAVRYQPDPDSARRGDLVIVPKDMLTEPQEWESPSNVGGSIMDPLIIGQYDDGSPLAIWLPGDPKQGRNAQHFLLTGGTGSGKGDTALNVQTEILSRRDVIMWLSDPKSFQDFRPLLPAYDWAVEGGAGTEAMVEALQHVIPARTGWLGKHSYRQWTPEAAERQTDPAHSCRPDGTACGCEGMPYMVAWMEEAANTLRNLGDDAFTGIAQEARSAGLSFIVSLQRPSYDQMSTSTRASLPSVIALGCDPRDEGFSLPDAVIDAGAHPGAWGNRKPGYCYVVAGGIDPDRYASPARTRQFTQDATAVMEMLAQWTVRNGAAADAITAGAAKAVVGNAYTGRRTDTDETGQVAVPDQDDTIQTGTQLDPEDAAMDPEADLPPAQQGDDTPLFGQETGRKPGPEEARELFARALDEFEAAGQMVIGPKDFMDWCDRNNLGRSWVSKRLKDAAMEGRLQPTSQTGRWRIVPVLAAA
ncbi:sporulation protein SsgA [Streptomyces sp. NBC_01362]|uniref:plasmid transfer protein TraB n=1 Tax=Streptomyces sp. NBC_01362 TaxID=2903839 RepID=UPI002E35915E|nr:plasmid transfer protein TraB [Streptomyces sp. NBC_01362]